MIILNAYNVSADGKWLTIDVAINPSFIDDAGVYIRALKVSCTGDYTDSSATTFDAKISEAVNEYDEEGGVIVWDENLKKIRIKLDVDTLNKPFYLLVMAADDNHVVTSCAHKNYLTAVTFNKYPLYQHIACSTKELVGCESPVHFIDYLLRLKALEASIAIGDTSSINYYYNWLILHGSSGINCNSSTPNVQPLNSGCGCH